MTSQDLAQLEISDSPGVYFFIGAQDKILYIGKATSLRDRVRSYFNPDVIAMRSQLIADMVQLAITVEYIVTDSVLEALILEANLIKKHQPKYNTKEKDNKSYNYVVFTNELFPKVLTIRGRTLLSEKDLKNYKYIYGPFPHSTQLKEAMKIIRKIFPYTDAKCTPNTKACFNRQIGLCPGVCTGEISAQEYAKQISHLKLFFEAKKKTLIKTLDKDMKRYAREHQFEKAAHTKKTIFALYHIQDIALLKADHKIDESSGGEFFTSNRSGIFRIEAYDIAHSSGTSVVGVMVVVEDSEVAKSEYRKFNIKINPGVNDTGALKEILRRRLGHLEWSLPSLIVVDGGKAQLNAAKAVLTERGFNIELVSVVKDAHHKPKEIVGEKKYVLNHSTSILMANSEAHRFANTFHRKKRDAIL